MKQTFLFFLSLLLAMTACKVGPKYQEPDPLMPLSFNEEKTNKTILVDDEDFIHWWTALNDPFLNELLEETLNANFDYRIALQRVYQARSQYWIQFTQILPELDFDAQATRFRSSQ